jgi:hypothetical protein
MTTALPTAKELEGLPLRAIAAYTARTSRRLSAGLRGLVADKVLDDVLSRVDALWKNRNAGNADVGSLMRAVADLYGAVSVVPNLSAHIVVICMSRAAQVANELVRAERDPSRAGRYQRRAAKKAEKVVNAIKDLDIVPTEAFVAARRDYEVLLNTYGVHNDVLIGDSVDCFTD